LTTAARVVKGWYFESAAKRIGFGDNSTARTLYSAVPTHERIS
jgi:hypothetical protein